jgi:uncharacterized protein YbaR (Trm112 family)
MSKWREGIRRFGLFIGVNYPTELVMLSCPSCKVVIGRIDDEKEHVPKYPRETYAVCRACGHIARITNYCGRLLIDKVIKADLDNLTDLKARQELRDLQEQVHFENGHWG